MNGYLTRHLATLVIVGLAVPAWAQTAMSDRALDPVPDNRDARFINTPPVASASPAFSGLAAPPQIISPAVVQPLAPVPLVAVPLAAAPVATVPANPAPVTQAADLGQKVDAAPLPEVSPESVGLSATGNLGANMWKGTSRVMAGDLLTISVPTASPVLNDLARRLLATAAVPPDGAADAPQQLTSLRIAKLVAFADAPNAWALAVRADAKAIDDITLHQTAEVLLADGGDSLCSQMPTLAKTRTSVDWQKALAVCQMRAKDTQGAQVTLDVLRAQAVRDDIFLQVADKNVLGTTKTLPSQLTPLTPALLAVLRLSGLDLPGELYGHPDYALVPALLRAPAKQDVAQLGLGERAAARGIINADALAALYKAIVFKSDALSSPLTSAETGSRLRALLYQAAVAEKDPQKRISYAVKFMQSTPPDVLNGAGGLLLAMVDGIKPDPALAANAVACTQIHMLAGDNTDAAAWFKLAKHDFTNPDFQILWPQSVLAGLEPDTDYAADIGKWSDAMLTQTDPKADTKPAHDIVAASLLLFDAAGYVVPDIAWVKIVTPTRNEKHIALSPILLERLRAAGFAEHRGEAVLLAVALAGDGDISLPAAIEITRALRLVGLKSEAAQFARQTLALLAKTN